MRVRNPDLLICKLRSIDALCFRAVIIHYDLASLHHKAWDDALEYSGSVM